jgi:hypothetical protein
MRAVHFILAVMAGTITSSSAIVGPDHTVQMNKNMDSWRFSLTSCHDSPTRELNQSEGGNAATHVFDWNLVSDRKPAALIWGVCDQ